MVKKSRTPFSLLFVSQAVAARWRFIVQNLVTREIFQQQYDKPVVATGAKSVVPAIEDINKANVFYLMVKTFRLLMPGWPNNIPQLMLMVQLIFHMRKFAQGFDPLIKIRLLLLTVIKGLPGMPPLWCSRLAGRIILTT